MRILLLIACVFCAGCCANTNPSKHYNNQPEQNKYGNGESHDVYLEWKRECARWAWWL